MGSIRDIKTQARVEELAAETRRREDQDRQWVDDYNSWLQEPDPNYSQFHMGRPPCFGSQYPAMGCPLPECAWCRVQGACVDDFADWYRHQSFDLSGSLDELENCERMQDELWAEEYDDWIQRQSQESDQR